MDRGTLWEVRDGSMDPREVQDGSLEHQSGPGRFVGPSGVRDKSGTLG